MLAMEFTFELFTVAYLIGIIGVLIGMLCTVNWVSQTQKNMDNIQKGMDNMVQTLVGIETEVKTLKESVNTFIILPLLFFLDFIPSSQNTMRAGSLKKYCQTYLICYE